MERADAIARLAELARLATDARSRAEDSAYNAEAVEVDPDPYMRECSRLASEYRDLVQMYLDKGVLRQNDLDRAGLPAELRC